MDLKACFSWFLRCFRSGTYEVVVAMSLDHTSEFVVVWISWSIFLYSSKFEKESKDEDRQ